MDEPRRVIIRARVTDIDGVPEARVKNLGYLFCSQVLQRDFNSRPGHAPRDEMHYLPGCDSLNPVPAWFIYDFNYAGELSKEQVREIAHEVYLASLVDGKWYDTVQCRMTLAPGLRSDET